MHTHQICPFTGHTPVYFTCSPPLKKCLLSVTGNYRPISLTSVPGKVLEYIIKDREVNFLKTNNLIITSQHCLVQGRSCVTNLLDRSRAVKVFFFFFFLLPQSLRLSLSHSAHEIGSSPRQPRKYFCLDRKLVGRKEVEGHRKWCGF